MEIPERLGRHRLALAGDVLAIQYDGPITVARKYMADRSKEKPEEALAGTAMYGMNFAMRAIISLTLNAIKFLGKKTELEGVVFLKDEAEARRWIDARRELKYPGGPHVDR